MKPSAFANLLGALAGIPDLRQGSCVGDDPTAWDKNSGPVAESNQATCRACPALEACADWAEQQPKGTLLGVVGGVAYGGPQTTTHKPTGRPVGRPRRAS